MIRFRSFQLFGRPIEVEMLLQVVHEHGIGFLGSRLGLCFEYDEFHTGAEEIATEANVDGCFDSIACQDPEFDSSVGEFLDGFGDTILETIFDGGSAEELEFSFDFVRDFFEFGFSVFDPRGRNFVSTIPFGVIFL
jgi:hypothetical protein